MENVSTSCKRLLTKQPRDCILTVNQRLSIELRRQYEATKQGAWLTPEILPLTTWLQQLWQHNATNTIVLSNWQALNIWLDIIEQDSDHVVVNSTKTAKLAQQAWQLLCQWSIELSSLDRSGNQDNDTFLHWAQLYTQICQRNNWICEACLPREIEQLLRANQITTLPAQITLSGFDEIIPAYQSLLHLLESQHHVKVEQQQSRGQQPPLQSIAFSDPQAELEHALTAAQQAHQQGMQRIGIIIPNLSQRRHEIRRQLHNKPPELYNISAGNPLTEYPIIQAALAALQLAANNIDVERAYLWLQSPYLTLSSADIDIGALLDAKLRSEEQPRLPKSRLFALLASLEKSSPSSWIKRLRNFNAATKETPLSVKPSELARHWCVWLDAIGWPGGRQLNSADYQLVERFNALLNEFASLDLVLPSISLTQGRHLLTLQCQNTAFQPEGSTAPIQILGLLESAGLRFQQLWLLGTDSETWPQAAKANPFIPLSVQRQCQMPHASAERQLLFSQKIFQRILNSAEKASLTWAETKDNNSIQPSSFMDKLKLIKADGVENIPDIKKTSHCDDFYSLLDVFDDPFAPPANDAEKTRGGSRLIQLQANCPFWAFTEIRLKAKPLQRPIEGLSAATRGNLVHLILETIWNSLNSQQQLRQLTEKQLNTLISASIARHIQDYASPQTHHNQLFFWQLEQQRLTKLIQEWLSFEKTRGDFIVIAHEIEQRIHIGPLTLTLKIDRIDQLPSGEKLIIDYKTGAANIAGWFGERPSAPQLPLYCSFETPYADINAIHFAEIKPQQLRLKGICSENTQTGISASTAITTLSGLESTSWQDLIDDWRRTLTQLSYEFSEGNACVSPLAKHTCQYCPYHSLCRIST